MPSETRTRYTITTPSPSTRLSLGKWQTGGDDGPIGYDGASLHAADYLFVDVGNHALLQSHETLSVHSKKWYQSASEGLQLTCGAEATLATSGLTTIVAGAGQPASFAIDHGETITPVVYNNLELHYRTEEIQNGLFEFFLGRYESAAPATGWLTKFMKEGRKFKPYAGDALTFMQTSALDARDGEPFPGGFAGAANASAKELVGGATFAAFEDLDVLAKNLTRPGTDKDALEYGYSRYFARHDPYLMLDPDASGPPWLAAARKALVHLVNGLARMRRTVDVCGKLASVVKDNALGKSVQDCLGLLDSVNKMVNAFYRFKTWVGVFKAIRTEYEKGIGAKAETARDANDASTDKATVRSMAAPLPVVEAGFALTITSNAGSVTTARVGDRVTVMMPVAGQTSLQPVTGPVDPPADADDLVDLLELAGAGAIVDVAVEEGALVLTSKTEGPGSFVRVTAGGTNTETLYGFVGDYTEAQDEDEIPEPPPLAAWNTIHGAVLDDKALPQDVANLVRPVTARYALTVKAVEETIGVAKSLAKVAGVTMPSSDGALGLLAKNGISLGTPDRIVGSASRGILLVADGSEGAPNRAKYVPFEDLFNQVTAASPLMVADEDEHPVSLGIRAFSDSTVDLAARETVRIGALGRAGGAAGEGDASVSILASDAAELSARRTAVVAARDGEVQVLGKHVGIGTNDMDAERKLGVGWDASVVQEETDRVVVHANKETIIVAGQFMVRVAFAREVEDEAVQLAERAAIDREITAVERALKPLVGADPEVVAKRALLEQKKAALEVERGLPIVPSPSKGPIGITLGMRDGSAHAFKKDKPCISLTADEVRVTSHFDEAGHTTTSGATTVLVTDKQLVLSRQGDGATDSVRLQKDGGILLKDSTDRTLQLKDGKLLGFVSDFSVNCKKVQLG